MPCYNPRRRFMRRGSVLWNVPTNMPCDDSQLVNIRCGKCLGCDRAVQRDWSLRCFHEALLHTENFKDAETGVTTRLPNSCVVTLTYDEAHLPADGALNHDDFKRFLKRLRIWRTRSWERAKKFGVPPEIRYFMCGEYGARGRPHFHAILYGVVFGDRYKEQSLDGQTNTMSAELDALWAQPASPGEPPTKIGRATIDEFSYAGAAYVAGYVAKKAGDKHRGPWQETIDTRTGEVSVGPLKPEYRAMSTRLPRLFGQKQPGGLGGRWLYQNLERTYESDTCRIGEYFFRPPRYYDILLARHRRDLVDAVKLKRLETMSDGAKEWTPERCSAAEAIVLSQLESRSSD